MFVYETFSKMIGEQIISVSDNSTTTKVEDKLNTILSWLDDNHVDHLNWCKIKIGFVSGNNENPLYKVVYYDKDKIGNVLKGFIVKNYDCFMVPKNYQEYIYRIFIDGDTNGKNKIALSKRIWKPIMIQSKR